MVRQLCLNITECRFIGAIINVLGPLLSDGLVYMPRRGWAASVRMV